MRDRQNRPQQAKEDRQNKTDRTGHYERYLLIFCYESCFSLFARLVSFTKYRIFIFLARIIRVGSIALRFSRQTILVRCTILAKNCEKRLTVNPRIYMSPLQMNYCPYSRLRRLKGECHEIFHCRFYSFKGTVQRDLFG